MKELDSIMRYLRETFALCPTREELELSFPHENGCGRSNSLQNISDLVFSGSGDPRFGSISFRAYYLQCNECGVKQRYRM